MANAYTADSIKHLSSVEAIRAKASMYLGELGEQMVFTTLRETLDNVVDEALNGRAKTCHTYVAEDGSYYVLDDGQGMPVGPMKVEDSVTGKTYTVSSLYAITGLLHAGGKLQTSKDSAYEVSRGCFHGTTRVRLLDGTVRTMEEIYNDWTRDQKDIPILSYNTCAQRIEPSVISFSQISKRTKTLVEVTYDNGYKSKVTPDHPFFVRRGGSIKRVAAERLQSGDSLVSTYYSHDKDGYLKLSENGVEVGVHRLVARHSLNRGRALAINTHVHHKSRFIQDNRPSNLEVLTCADHQREHSEDRSLLGYAKIMDSQEGLRRENSERFTDQNAEDWHKQQSAETKAVRIGVRTMATYGKLTPRSYELARRANDFSLETIVALFGAFEIFVNRVVERFEHLQSRVGRSSVAEALLTGHTDLPVPGVIQKVASDRARFLQWHRRLSSFDDPRSVTPSQWNSGRKGAFKVGHSAYANLCQFTSLKAVKAHVLDGDELAMYEDQSDEARTRRRLKAELRVTPPQKRLSYVTSCVKRLRSLLDGRRFSVSWFNKVQPRGGKPELSVMLAFFADHLGVESVDDDAINLLIDTWNHTVQSVRRINLTNAIPVYDITVDKNHAFFIDAGPATTKLNDKSRGEKGFFESGVLVSNSHGIGIKGTNFVSRFFSVSTFFKGQWWNIEYQNGRVTTEVNKLTKAPAHPWLKGTLKSGTLIHFKPDPKIVNGEKFPLSMYGEWAKIAAYFTPGLTVSLTDFKGREKSWCFPEGPARYVTDRITQIKCNPIEADKAPFTFTSPFADVVVQWTDYDGCDFQAFTNGLNNPDKGVHFSAFFSALQVSLDPYAGKKHKFGHAELREGVVGLVNAKLSAPKFSSQTKDKMVDDRADKPLHEALKVALSAFFAKNKKFAETICARADQLRALKSQFTASKKVLTVLAKARTKGLPAKCSSAPNCKPEARELYVVEGESAGGSCFPGSTLLTMSDGSRRSIDALLADGVEWSGISECDHIHVVSSMSAPVLTKFTTDLVEITLEDGTVVRCTPDHRVLTDSGYVRADKLDGHLVVKID